MKKNLDIDKEIQKILLNEWDPIGVKDIPEAVDEYDSYIPIIKNLIIGKSSQDQIFKLLQQIETQNIGLDSDAIHTMAIAAMLSKL
jgi:hypothetical protein